MNLSVLFVDIRYFTGLSERIGPRDLVATLNALYHEVVSAIQSHGGRANRFIGDRLAIFGSSGCAYPLDGR